MRVMLCDDDEAFRALCRTVLGRASQVEVEVVAEAGDGDAAIELARTTPLDAVLLDLEMPTMDGLTALPLLRRAAPDARIVVLSGMRRDDARTALLEALGATAVLRKPYFALDLCAQVEDALLH